ncbi:oxaloacetate decarboxylase subunit gamma [Testudinibacter sp. P27/CKL/0425]
MTAAELMGEGVNLMLSGMGFVLLFLLILIFAIRLMSNTVNRFFPETIKSTQSKQVSNVSANAAGAVNDVDALRPIIVAAIAHHRRQQQNN